MSETYEAMLKRHEGYRTTIYVDSLGVETIGYGHNLHKPITRKAAEQIFADDVADAKGDCIHHFPWFYELTEARQWVLINMCFNLGINRLLGFKKFLTAVAMGDYETAANEMLSSLWARQVKGRARELAQLMRGTATEV